jgi:hypothetical protein
MSRRYRALHFNLQEGVNVVFHREHRSKRGRKLRKETNLLFKKYKFIKKYGKDAEIFKKQLHY